jgi:hypothetical protein
VLSPNRNKLETPQCPASAPPLYLARPGVIGHGRSRALKEASLRNCSVGARPRSKQVRPNSVTYRFVTALDGQ